MKRSAFVLALALTLGLPAAAAAQTVVTGTQKFAFDYKIADVTTYGVVRFEINLDNSGVWTSVGMAAVSDDAQTTALSHTYVVPIPALVTGPHSVTFRACNANICGDPMAVVPFTLTVQPAVVFNFRFK